MFCVWGLKSKVTQLLDGSLGLNSGPVVMDSTVEWTEPALHSASGRTGALEGNGEPGKTSEGLPGCRIVKLPLSDLF